MRTDVLGVVGKGKGVVSNRVGSLSSDPRESRVEKVNCRQRGLSRVTDRLLAKNLFILTAVTGF